MKKDIQGQYNDTPGLANAGINKIDPSSLPEYMKN
jgi:hypothetical protein